jgi:hypothetical protein
MSIPKRKTGGGLRKENDISELILLPAVLGWSGLFNSTGGALSNALSMGEEVYSPMLREGLLT